MQSLVPTVETGLTVWIPPLSDRKPDLRVQIETMKKAAEFGTAFVEVCKGR